MSIYEYDAELHEKTLQQLGYEKGRIEGITEAITTTVSFLKENDFSDKQITEALVHKFKLLPEDAEKYISKI